VNKHINLTGFLYLVFGGLGVIALIFQALAFIVGSGFIAVHDERATFIFGTIGLILVLIAAVASIPNLIVGWGLIKRRPWARVFTIVWSIFNLFAFPFGTMLGAYALWVMFQPETSDHFRQTPADLNGHYFGQSTA